MTEEEMLRWVEGASYEQLLRKQRFEPIGSPWFITESVAERIFARMAELRAAPGGREEAVRASKAVGW